MATPQRASVAVRPAPAGGSGFLDELRLIAESSPQKQVLLAPGRSPITAAELLGRISSVTGSLTDAGVTRSQVVAVVMTDGPDLLSIILGALSVAICAPINPALRKTELEQYLRDLGARALIVDRAADSPVREAAEELGISVLDAQNALDNSARARMAVHERGSNVALLLQTSATTGKSRIVPLTHSNFGAMAANTQEILQLAEQDRFLSMMPLFHLQGLLSSVAQLLRGGSVISTAGFDASMFTSWIEQFHPTWYTATPPLHNAILPLMEARPELLERFPLRFVRSIGAPLPQTLRAGLERALGVPALEGYGLTEAGMVTSNAPPPQQRKPESVGRSGGVEVAILGDRGELLPAGRDGEIAVRGPAVIRGYHNNAEADRIAFRNGWLLTGDVGYLDEEGFLFVTGRIKDIINRGGEKVLPVEIDEVLSAHPLVSEAVTFGIPHQTLGEDVAVAVVLVPGASVTEPELRRFAADHLADFKVPRRIIFLDAVPKGPTGKAQRAKLAEQFAEEASLPANPDGALTLIEKRLETIWKRVLRVENVGVRDDFFGIGGDSLGLTLLMSEIECEFGVDGALVEEPEFFSNSTIETLANAITRAAPVSNKGSRSSLVAIQPRGSRMPFFCIPGADENPYYFRDLAKGLGDDQPFYALRDPRPREERGIYSVEEHAELFSAAIRAARPHGPYVLGGHCYGGILSFEVARQLVAMGEEVRLLALFEAPTPGYPKVVRHWKNYLRQSRHARWADVHSHARVLTGLLRRKTEAFTRRGVVAMGLKSVVAPLERIDCRNRGAGRSYEPKELRCKVVQFIAAGEQLSTLVLEDPRLGWREHVGEGFSVQTVPGRHEALFMEPSVSKLASQLRGVLDGVNVLAADKRG